MPRTKFLIYVPPKKKKKREIWEFKKSLFYPWTPDNEELIAKCFDFDWNTSKISKSIVKEIDKKRQTLFLKKSMSILSLNKLNSSKDINTD